MVLHPDGFAQMAVASVAHLYIFPATPYNDLEGGKDRSVKVLADYAAFDSPLDPEEIRESERPSMVKFFGVDVEKGATSVKESVHDVLVVGGNHVSSFPLYLSLSVFHFLLAAIHCPAADSYCINFLLFGYLHFYSS